MPTGANIAQQRVLQYTREIFFTINNLIRVNFRAYKCSRKYAKINPKITRSIVIMCRNESARKKKSLRKSNVKKCFDLINGD